MGGDERRRRLLSFTGPGNGLGIFLGFSGPRTLYRSYYEYDRLMGKNLLRYSFPIGLGTAAGSVLLSKYLKNKAQVESLNQKKGITRSPL